MELKRTSFEDSLQFGEDGEHEVAKILINRGVTLMPLYQYNKEHAPYLLNVNGNITSPDLLCFKNDCFFVEVKTKNQWVEYCGEMETGFDLKHFEDYRKIFETTNKKVYVFFNHKTKDPQGIYYIELMKYTRIWDGKVKAKQVHKATVFYKFEDLKKLTT